MAFTPIQLSAFTPSQLLAFTREIDEDLSLKQMITEKFGSVANFVKDCQIYFSKWKDGFGMDYVCLGETEEYFELVFKIEEYRKVSLFVWNNLYSKYVRTADDVDDTGMNM